MANTFITPSVTQNLDTARLNWNDSMLSLLTNFYGPANPTISNFTIDGSTPASISNGVLFRSSTLGTLFIKDDLNHQNNPFYTGNFTRNGIGYIVEDNIIALEANAASRERGEILVTPESNTRIYIKSNSASNSYADIGIPPINSIVSSMIQNSSITIAKLDINSSNVVLLNNNNTFFGGTVTFVKNNQFGGSNSAVELRVNLSDPTTTDVIFPLRANGSSNVGAAIVHRDGGSGIEITELSNTDILAPVNASEYKINGISFSTFPTSTIISTIESSGVSGWLYLNGNTMGNVSSGANDANVLYESLFKLLWDNVSNTYAPVNPGRGANAQFDWDSNKTIKLPDMRGRSSLGIGTGIGLTTRTIGENNGSETHTLSLSEIPPHKHELPTSTNASDKGLHNDADWSHGSSGISRSVTAEFSGIFTSSQFSIYSGPMESNASATAHNNMHPWVGIHRIIKY